MSEPQRHTVVVTGSSVTVQTAFYPTGAATGGGGSATLPTGSLLLGMWTTAPSGYVLLNGSTIGKLGSGATYASPDASDLYTLLWTNLTNTYAPVSTGRGASAAADFAAGKTLTVPDMRERVPLGTKSGTTIAGVDAIMGATLGTATQVLTEAQLPVVAGHNHAVGISHTHEIAILAGAIETVAGSAGVQGVSSTSTNTAGIVADALSGTTDSGGGFGSGTAHNNVQKSLCVNYAIKL